MPATCDHPAKRDVGRTQASKSRFVTDPERVAESAKIKLAILVPLVFAANVIAAVIAWYAVGSFLR
jgi:hypothetical protein